MERKGYRSPGWSASGYLRIFEGSYGDGETRILAQEPVQNAKDARSEDSVVHVEYRLLQRIASDGRPFSMLAVTDSGTTGLCGKTNPSNFELKAATVEDREQLKWYHFERLFDSNKKQLQSGSRGWGKTIFLECSRIPHRQNSAMMIYDTLLKDGEYRVGDMTIWDDNFGVREEPLLNDEARAAISNPTYRTPDGNVRIPLGLKPLKQVGTRVIVPFLTAPAVKAVNNGSLARWLQYLWWRPIAEGILSIAIINEFENSKTTIVPPEWWQGNIWSSDATTPGPIHKLHEGCHIQVLVNLDLGKDCAIKHLALLYDAKLRAETSDNRGLRYDGIQLLRSWQCIETLLDFERIPVYERQGIRAFVEFDDDTDLQLRDKEKTQHDGFNRSFGIVSRTILPQLREIVHKFAEEIAIIKSQPSDMGASNEKYRRTSQFVFERLLSKAMGEVSNESSGEGAEGETDKPWDVDVLLSYPNPGTTRVYWGDSIANIRFVINSLPETVRRNIRFALEWQSPATEYKSLREITKRRAVTQYGLGDFVLTEYEPGSQNIVCEKPGLYRIRAAVYEGKRLVAKKAKRIHVEIDPPERKEHPYAVSISVENISSPGEKRIEAGDNLRLQINGRNRTQDDVSGTLLLRTREGALIVSDEPFEMPGKPLGGDERRHMLHSLRLQVERGEPGEAMLRNGLLTLALEPGKHVMQAYLLDGRDELAFGSYTMHFESEPARSQGGLPFELIQVLTGTPPMWELRSEESKLHFSANYPIHSTLLQVAEQQTAGYHNPFELEINVNGLLQWAIEPLLEEEADPTRLESLRNAKPNLVDDDAWDWYMECLSDLENSVKMYGQGQPVSPIDFALKWRKTVAAIYPILIPQENH